MPKLESLRLRAIALRSTIHNEQMMNAQELCGMVSKKTNEIIDVVNEIIEEVENFIATYEAPAVSVASVYDEANENLGLEITQGEE